MLHRLQDLDDSDLKLIESILLEAFQKQSEQDKNRRSFGYERPFERSNRILNCVNAVRSQRQFKEKLAEKW
tara:strand:- start:84 stop:296 length:213 start_codon:yes stop_codon:yes gene_type:complete